MDLKKLLIILAILFMASTVWSAPFLVCDCQDNVDYYVIVIDGGTPINSEAVSTDCTGDQKRLSLDMAPLGLSDGQHSLVGRAGNVWGESTDVPFDFNKTIPSTQSGIGLSATP
jgi:hypothetical protein